MESSKLKTGTSGATSGHCDVFWGYIKHGNFLLLGAYLLAYQTKLCCMEIVSLEVKLS